LYSISATLNDEQVPNTPLALEYSIPPPVASQCKILGLEDEHLMVHQVDKNIFFQVDTRLAGNGKLNIKAGPPRGKPKLEAKPSPAEKHIIDVTYVPNVPGKHTLKVSWSGEEVPRSPLAFDVESIPRFIYGKPVEHDLELGDVAESDLSCLFFQEESGIRFKGKIHKLAKNKYSFAFKPKEPGLYSLWVYVKMREIKRSPIYLFYTSPPKPEAVVVRDIPDEVYVLEPARFTVDTTNAGMSQLKVKVTPPKRGKDGELTVTDNKDGTYTVQHVPKVTGTHSFAITWDKKSIPDSPVKLRVKRRGVDDGRLSIASEISEQSLPQQLDIATVQASPLVESSQFMMPRILSVPEQATPIGCPVSVDIDTKHSDAGTLKINQSGTGQAEVQFQNKGNGIYGCSITPTATGTCRFDVVFNGQSIDQSPFTLDFCGIAGVALEGEVLQVGMMHKFDINCALLREGKLEVLCDDPDAAHIITSLDGEKKTYNCSISPKCAGKNTISVKYNGYHIAGSPFSVDFVQPSSSNMVFSLVTPTGMDTSDVSANLQTLDHQQVPLELNQLSSGQFSLDFVPTQGSEFLLTIKCLVKMQQKEVKLAGGHFTLSYTTESIFATRYNIEGKGIAVGHVGSWSSFTVEAEEASEFGELSAVFEDEEDISSGPVITPIIPSLKYEVKYLVKKSGNFKILLSSNGKPIPGSPYNVTCSLPEGTASIEDSLHFTSMVTHQELQSSVGETSSIPKPENVKVHGPGLTEGIVGETRHFTIETEGAGHGSIDMNVTGPEGQFKVDLEKIPDREGMILATYLPQAAGTYSFDVLWGGDPVPGSPFTVNIN
jgi:filamin